MRIAVVKRLAIFAGPLALAVTISAPAEASARDAGLCEQAAVRAARQTGVPRDVLLAITLTETGRATDGGPLRPWPWAVNVAGQGHWFASREEAVGFAEDHIRNGSSNFDVGCFQLNHRWHGGAFTSPDQMFDPEANALYAASYLKTLKDRSGDWAEAAGAYHSATPALAERYRSRFDQLYSRLSDDATPADQFLVRTNRYPLLQLGDAGSTGSLVPLAASARPLFGK
ncbi:lytic transglycosylase domain-containing protein [Cereibacter ovatus]|uniref:lytic transglycosylase domain-containing protein n=1 Tax=Cereibacter ovatus TaxID=439529 RepID=UPI000BE42E01|nr:lytic transglycosylase domain-containing protein [Cereibacter ovatus]